MTAASDHRLDLVELGEICARCRACELDLFQALGSWVGTTRNPRLQQLFAEAGHRHAWHAELWLERTPAIPPIDPEALTSSFRSTIDAASDVERADRYRRELVGLRARLDEITGRTDPLLDPSTVRVVRLVAADVDELRIRLDGAGSHG